METITNDSLRLKIASIYDINYKHLTEFQKGFDYQNAYDNKKMHLTKFKDWRLHKSATPLNYKEFKNNNEFLNLLNFTSDSQAISIYQYQLTVTKCMELISEIEKEIIRLQNK